MTFDLPVHLIVSNFFNFLHILLQLLSHKGVDEGSVYPQISGLFLELSQLSNIIGEDLNDAFFVGVVEFLDKVCLVVRSEIGLEERNISFEALVHFLKIS